MKSSKIKHVLKCIEKNKVYLGMGDWEFTVKPNQDIDSIARIETDMWEKEATIYLNKTISNKKVDYILDVVKHELVHGRYAVMKQQYEYEIEKIEYRFEEELINDIVRWNKYTED